METCRNLIKAKIRIHSHSYESIDRRKTSWSSLTGYYIWCGVTFNVLSQYFKCCNVTLTQQKKLLVLITLNARKGCFITILNNLCTALLWSICMLHTMFYASFHLSNLIFIDYPVICRSNIRTVAWGGLITELNNDPNLSGVPQE